MKRSVIAGIIISTAVLAAVAGAKLDKPIEASGLDAFQKPRGTWEMVGKVSMDPANSKALAAEPGSGILFNGPAKHKTAHLITKKEYADMELHLEFLIPEKSNSGIYLMSRYEVQVFDSAAKGDHVKYSDCGGIYQRWDASRGKGKQGYEGHAPRVNASLPPGQWQTFDIVFRAPRFDKSGRKIQNARFVKVLLNGKLVQENVEVTGPTRAAKYTKGKEDIPLGPLMIQGDHGPIAIRNIVIKPLKLD